MIRSVWVGWTHTAYRYKSTSVRILPLFTLSFPPSPNPVMFLVASLVPFVVLANIVVGLVANSTVVRKPPISLHIARKIGKMGGTELVATDRRRAQCFVTEGCTFHPGGTLDVGVINNNTLYVASVGVGLPATNCGSY